MVTEKDLLEALDDALNCVLCFCGNHKRMGKPFCFRCWDRLPSNWKQIRIWLNPIGGHHEYDAAKEWLKKHSGQILDRDTLPLS